MDNLFTLLTYPIQRVVALLFSLSIDGTSIGALLVSAILLGILFKALIGLHLNIFSRDTRSDRELIDSAKHRQFINDEAKYERGHINRPYR